MRVAWNPLDARYIACFGLDTADVNIIDARAPAVPVAILPGHDRVCCCQWSPISSGHLMTAGTPNHIFNLVIDEGSLALWDLSKSIVQPQYTYNTNAPTRQLVWREPNRIIYLTMQELYLLNI